MRSEWATSIEGWLTFIVCCFALVANSYLVLAAWRRSPLGTVTSVVMLQILVGTALVPFLSALGLGRSGFHATQYLLQNKAPGLYSGLHLGLFSIGSLLGWHFGLKHSSSRSFVAVIGWPLFRLDAFRCTLLLLSLSFLSYAALFALVDWDVLLSNARGASREVYGEQQSYLFLKSVASVGMYSVCFLPSMLKHGERARLSFVCGLILFYVILTFAIGISRNLILWTALVPAVVLIRYSGLGLLGRVIGTLSAFCFAAFVLVYGKSYSQVQRRFVTDGELSSLESSGGEGALSALLANLEFQWYSIDAGIRNCLDGNPPPLLEFALAISIGFVPAGMLESAGFGDLAYSSHAERGISFINASYFSLGDGTVPPGIVGYSAYLGPWLMGFVVGFLFLFLLSSSLQFSRRSGLAQASAVSWFCSLLVINWMSFIPMAGALATFCLIVMYAYSFGSMVLRR